MKRIQFLDIWPGAANRSINAVGLAFAMLTIVAGSSQALANIRLPKIFSDHMVVQQNKPINIWGWANQGEELTIQFGEFKGKTTSDSNGRWRIAVPAMEASGPFELTVAGKGARVVFKDVYVGEVWLCSGQSNMEWSVEQTLETTDEEDKHNKLQEYTNPQIRFFTVGRSAVEKFPEDFTEAARWTKCTPESARSFSAVAYHFADHLLKQQEVFNRSPDKKVMIGLVNSTWGGTPCEAWVSEGALKENPELAPLVEHWSGKVEVNSRRPGALFNGMIAPLINFNIRGTIWYQGESNVGRGEQYRSLFSTLIADWRNHFGAEMPFYFVQLAPYRYNGADPRALAEVWEAQLATLKSVPQTGMAVTTDIGDLKDIHPKNKREVGRRLALWALANTYDVKSLVYSGPIFEQATIDGDSIVIKFSHVGSGLQSGNGALTQFQISGQDQAFVDAVAQIEGSDMIRVAVDSIKHPVAVRFAWDDSAQPNLFNSAGLPASPFRSDDFDLLSKGISY